MAANPILGSIHGNPLLTPSAGAAPGDPTGPRILRRHASTLRKKCRRLMRTRTAADLLADWNPTEPLAIATAGQVALSDLLGAVADKLGTPDVIASAWAASHADLDFLLGCVASGRFAGLGLILDRLLASRDPEAVAQLRRELGDRLAITRTHGRFALLRTATTRVAILTTADLTANLGLEIHLIDPDLELFNFLDGLAADLFRVHAKPATTPAEITTQFRTLTHD
jgi:hypothetical protein